MQVLSSQSGPVNGTETIRCVAGILVGGQSRRMGLPKHLLPLTDGRTLIEHVVDAITGARRRIDELLLLGRAPKLPNSLASLRVLPDVEIGAGPLSGLCALLNHAGQRWGLLLACDMPLLEFPLLERLCNAASPNADAVAYSCPTRPDTWHACCALYHPRILPAAMKELKAGRSLQALLASVHVTTLTPAPAEQRMLSNLNTPQDYQALIHQVVPPAPVVRQDLG